MPKITIDLTNSETCFELVLAGGVQPSLVDVRADLVISFFQLEQDGKRYIDGVFNANWFFDGDAQLLILQRYDDTIHSPTRIRTEADAVLRLQLLDFRNGKSALCSQLHGGRFEILGLAGRTLSYVKVSGTIRATFDASLDELKWTRLKKFNRSNLWRKW